MYPLSNNNNKLYFRSTFQNSYKVLYNKKTIKTEKITN